MIDLPEERKFDFFLAGLRKRVNIAQMNTKDFADWRADLDGSRDLSDLDKQGYGFLLSWFECGMEEVRLEVKLRKTTRREPVVLTREELMDLLDRLEGQYRLAAELQYGGGRRYREGGGVAWRHPRR